MISIKKLYEARDMARVLKVSSRNKELITPSYFPAISSIESKTAVNTLVHLVIRSSYPRLFLSAYDIFTTKTSTRRKLDGEIYNYIRSKGFLMLDSGVFEGYWKDDHSWKFESYSKVVSKIDSDFYFTFDVLPEYYSSEKKYFNSAVRNAIYSNSLNKKSTCIPIIHGKDPQKLLQSVRKFIRDYGKQFTIIAVPERECGNGFVERANTISQLRKMLNTKAQTQLLHILGCGNPLSLATYAYCGADTFDSTDWNRFVIEPNELTVYDFALLEILNCSCEICTRVKDNSATRVSLHNLLFYEKFIAKIQRMIRDNTLYDFLLEFIGKEIIKKIGK